MNDLALAVVVAALCLAGWIGVEMTRTGEHRQCDVSTVP